MPVWENLLKVLSHQPNLPFSLTHSFTHTYTHGVCSRMTHDRQKSQTGADDPSTSSPAQIPALMPNCLHVLYYAD